MNLCKIFSPYCRGGLVFGFLQLVSLAVSSAETELNRPNNLSLSLHYAFQLEKIQTTQLLAQLSDMGGIQGWGRGLSTPLPGGSFVRLPPRSKAVYTDLQAVGLIYTWLPALPQGLIPARLLPVQLGRAHLIGATAEQNPVNDVLARSWVAEAWQAPTLLTHLSQRQSHLASAIPHAVVLGGAVGLRLKPKMLSLANP